MGKRLTGWAGEESPDFLSSSTWGLPFHCGPRLYGVSVFWITNETHSVSYLSSTSVWSGIRLGVRDIAMNETEWFLFLWGLHSSGRWEQRNDWHHSRHRFHTVSQWGWGAQIRQCMWMHCVNCKNTKKAKQNWWLFFHPVFRYGLPNWSFLTDFVEIDSPVIYKRT